MGTNERLFWRELGCRRPRMGRTPKLLEGSGPLAFERSFNSSEDLMKRLSQTAEFRGDAASVSNVTWSPDGQFLAAGGEDCRVTVWEPGTRQLRQTMDMGHTSFINSVRYLPSRNNEYIVSASNDKEVRLANLVKGAIMPYKNHKGKVKSIAVIDPAMFMTAGEDGTVRQVDLRENGRAMTLIADQRGEKTGLVKSRVPINSIALCPLHPHLFATGGGDAIVRLYDRRMSSGQGSKPHKTPWFAGYMPMHFKSTLAHRPRPMPPLRPNVHISGVAFSHDGCKLFASYTNEQIYSFSCKQHQRAAAYFEAPDPSAHATRSTARLHRPTERRWPTAAWSRDSAEAAQPSARGADQQQEEQTRAPRGGDAASAAQAAARGAQAAEHAPGTVPLATAITMATQHFVQSFQTQPPDEAFRDRVREMAEEIHAQAAPAPEGASGGPEEAHAPDQAQPRRAASAPMPEVGQGAEAFTVGSFANAVILGVNAAFQQGQAVAADTAGGAQQDAHANQARSASRRQPPRAAAAASVAEGDTAAPVEEEQQEAHAPRQASRRGGSRGRLASRSGSAQAPLAQSIGRVAPGPARESPSALDAPNAVPPTAAQAVHSPVTRQAARRAGQPHQATRPTGALAAADQDLGQSAALSPNRLSSTLRDSRIQARREEAEAELARVGPPARRQRRTLDEPGSPGQSAVSAPRQPAQLAADPGHAARAALAHGMEGQAADAPRPVRQTASTLAAAGNAFAVAGRNAERPTASTGTSRPLTRQQASLKKEEGSPDVPEQASGHTGQPRAFRAPLPRTRGGRHAVAAALGTAEAGPAELPAGQAPPQTRPIRQRRMRRQKGDASDCHSGAGSTSRRAARPSGQQEQTLPRAARPAQAVVGEASSGLPTAQPAAPGQSEQRMGTRAVSITPTQNQPESQQLGAAAPVNSTGDRDNQNALDVARTGAARRRQSRAAPAAAGGSEPSQDAEDVCCERTQSGRGQDKRDSGAASPASVQREPAEQHYTEPAGTTTGAAAAALSAAERPAHAQACTDEANAAAGQQASPQQATIQDGASQGPRQRQLGTGQQQRQAAAAATAMELPVHTEAPEGVSEAGVAGGPPRLPFDFFPTTISGLPPPNEHVMAPAAQQRGLDIHLPARSSPNSSAAAIDTVQQGDDEADVVGPSAQQRHARLGAARAGTARAGEQREQQQGADSYIGAILDVCDADDGEVVEEDGMFDMVYSGHCNKQGCKEVSLIGEHSDFVCSGSDGGSIFIWNAQTGQLVNVLRANETVTTCVAPHPHVPMLASCGFEPAVRLWSPEAGEATKLEHADEVMRQNALELAQRSEHQMAAPQILLNMGLVPPAAALPVPAPAPAPELHLHLNNRDNAVRCTIM